MINNSKNKRMYSCCICGAHTTTLHEVVFGNGKRSICEKYNIQVPLCQRCHQSAHGLKDGKVHREYDCMSQNDCIDYFLSGILNISTGKTIQAVNLKDCREYLEGVKDACREVLRSYEV